MLWVQGDAGSNPATPTTTKGIYLIYSQLPLFFIATFPTYAPHL
jgi:hypothetical protein